MQGVHSLLPVAGMDTRQQPLKTLPSWDIYTLSTMASFRLPPRAVTRSRRLGGS